MFKAIRIAVLLLILLIVGVNTWLSQARSTDWNNSLWVKVYPINADGSDAVQKYISDLETDDFASIETFLQREASRYGKPIGRPVRMELGRQVSRQPPEIDAEPGAIDIMRGAYDLHTGPDKGWPDVAYNFFVAPDGSVWEGRAGSLDGPVTADATGGNQGYSQLVCLLGNHVDVPPTAICCDFVAEFIKN